MDNDVHSTVKVNIMGTVNITSIRVGEYNREAYQVQISIHTDLK
jgi:hypothetical protein